MPSADRRSRNYNSRHATHGPGVRRRVAGSQSGNKRASLGLRLPPDVGPAPGASCEPGSERASEPCTAPRRRPPVLPCPMALKRIQKVSRGVWADGSSGDGLQKACQKHAKGLQKACKKGETSRAPGRSGCGGWGAGTLLRGPKGCMTGKACARAGAHVAWMCL